VVLLKARPTTEGEGPDDAGTEEQAGRSMETRCMGPSSPEIPGPRVEELG
jgi:hypothetical protein